MTGLGSGWHTMAQSRAPVPGVTRSVARARAVTCGGIEHGTGCALDGPVGAASRRFGVEPGSCSGLQSRASLGSSFLRLVWRWLGEGAGRNRRLDEQVKIDCNVPPGSAEKTDRCSSTIVLSHVPWRGMDGVGPGPPGPHARRTSRHSVKLDLLVGRVRLATRSTDLAARGPLVQ